MIHQGSLELAVNKLFPNQLLKSNARKETLIVNPTTGSFLELDVWLPNINLCFEFQDIYHYTSTWDSHLPLEYVQAKDNSKAEAVRIKGETLIVVPCWWDGEASSLAASVIFQRPELTPDVVPSSEPISLTPPALLFEEGLNGVGGLMLASFPTDIQFDVSADTPWWLGEKYDGIRFCWNPKTKQTYTRSGASLELLDTHTTGMPNTTFMDGEIWFGRGSFLSSQMLVGSESEDIDWHFLRAVVFDNPSNTSRFQKFESRYNLLLSGISTEHPFISIAPRVFCTSHQFLALLLNEIIKSEGEGIVLRKPKSFYEPGRSENLLKLKATRGDKEALVVNVEPDSSLILQLPNGTIFTVSTHLCTIVPSPLPGEIVSFSFENFSKNSIPVKPKIYRIRKDVDWKEVVRANHEEEKPKATLELAQTTSFTRMPYGYWNEAEGKNMRNLMEKYARQNHLDPLVAESWYSFAHQLRYKKGIGVILQKFKGSVVRALQKLFPELSLVESKFKIPPRNYWRSVVNRREFFRGLALVKGFDPLIPDNWNNIQKKDLFTTKKMSSVLGYYRKGFVNALSHVFPEFSRDQFSKSHWLDINNRRAFFENFALSKKFDPKNPENWYSIDPDVLISYKGGKMLLAYYKGDWISALINVYPFTVFNISKFTHYPKNYWKEEENRRNFFIDVARLRGLDPLLPSTWYSFTNTDLVPFSNKVVQEILGYYRGSLFHAIISLLPHVPFQECKFLELPANYWTEKENHKKMFESFAIDYGVDPLSAASWYTVSRDDILAFPGGKSVLAYYKRSHVLALLHIFPSIGLDRSKFDILPRQYWHEVTNRRNFFVNFAKENGFDPLVLLNWSQLERDVLSMQKGARNVLSFYGGDLMKAITQLFPEIDGDSTTGALTFTESVNIAVEETAINTKIHEDNIVIFPVPPSKPLHISAVKNGWQDPKREFFISLAQKEGFDPNIPSNWYNVTERAILAQEGAAGIMTHYKGNFIEALRQLFPELQLDGSQFISPPQSYWLTKRAKAAF